MSTVPCKVSRVVSDVRCRVCGQGFWVEWQRQNAADRASSRNRVEEHLRSHHAATSASEAHPHDWFNVALAS